MKKIKNYDDYYIATCGRVISTKFKNMRFLKPDISKKGYLLVRLSKNGKKKGMLIHRIVAEHYIDNPLNKEQVNHIDENKYNNSVFNLEWSTPKENANHGTRNEKISNSKKKIVGQYALDGEFIMKYSSVSEASKITGCSRTHIGSVCSGNRKSCGGFFWKLL